MSGHPEILAARRLLRSQHSAALATLSKRLDGHPFATAVDYLTDHAGCPVFLISALAEHARNIAADPRVSLLVQGNSGEAQASPRLTLAGKAVRAADEQHAGLQQRYLRYFPEAEPYFALDFFFCRIEPSQLRYIGGFGAARWIAHGDFKVAGTAGWQAAENTWIEQHQDLIGMDCDGYDLRHGMNIVRVDFSSPITDPGQVKIESSQK
ncbi:MAG: pyridoxamine 5'-phosphate oxidase family protein [Sulfurimicrobium sp.]|jgi:hypothetical protein|nr:pyridoxamine 5'-phosphate oxidase family protein [Sulfurimicrobium sp.]MDO9188278.1 pyridoxamine 5'-phosphate oxidase family protein [Sulfurimicrobium sp.]MDP1704744.1 pyridoxamine 5'-phosphate oxidase family protein [Sulfurimicrobium sp.]MDP1898783.1 pyridoxamine 5'-phosphate oxidase family protein [Sulfurimicrobium sp.]MDP2197212.1 pyridoxamine 5'-phosphate oxidase family protein [Sulfurimicrobium sp.]